MSIVLTLLKLWRGGILLSDIIYGFVRVMKIGLSEVCSLPWWRCRWLSSTNNGHNNHCRFFLFFFVRLPFFSHTHLLFEYVTYPTANAITKFFPVPPPFPSQSEVDQWVWKLWLALQCWWQCKQNVGALIINHFEFLFSHKDNQNQTKLESVFGELSNCFVLL